MADAAAGTAAAADASSGADVIGDRGAAGGGGAGAAAASESMAAQVAGADEMRLAHAFYDAYRAARKLLDPEAEAAAQAEVDALTRRLKAIAARVAQLRLFSPNEELDDISTADLKFLLVPCLVADVLAASRDMAERTAALRQALVFWRGYAADCQRLGIGHRDDLLEIDGDADAKLDAAAKRDGKIARYKRTKELDGKIAYLFGKKREVLGDEYHWGHGGGFDEDMERELILSLLGRAVASAAEGIASAQQELPLLEIMAARGGPGAARPERPPTAEKPFIVRIQDKAECMRLYKEMVFQCPHELPTMTLAECAEIEMDQMHERQTRQADLQRRQRAEEDDRWLHGDRQGAREDDEDEKATYKARDWDDWKDEHPWGSGNKMANVG